MSSKLDQLREQGLEHEAFREGYDARDKLIRLGKLLKATRESSGLTQDLLAAKIGMQQSTVSRLESGFGPHGPEMDTLMRFVQGCNAELVVGIRTAASVVREKSETSTVPVALSITM